MKNRITILISVFILGFICVIPVNAARSAPVKLTANKTKVNVGDKVTISIDYSNTDYYYNFTVSNSNNGIGTVSGIKNYIENSAKGSPDTITLTAKKAGKTIIRVVDRDTLHYASEESAPATGSITIEVVDPSTKPTTPTTPPKVDDTEGDKANNQKTPEQIEKEQLEARQRTPLIKSIDVVSKSERANGETLTTLNTSSNLFNYKYVLPKKVDAFELDFELLGDDVVLTYDKAHVFSSDENKKEVIVKAVQDKVSQEFTITIERSTVSSEVLLVNGDSYHLVDDDVLDASMKSFGFERVNVEASETGNFYYELGSLKLQLATDANNNAKWFVVGEDLSVIREVVLVSNDDHKLSFLIDAPDSESRSLEEKGVRTLTLSLPAEILSSDTSLVYRNTILAWEVEAGIIAYGLDENGVEDMFYLDDNYNAKSTFVMFDRASSNDRIWAMAATGAASVLAVSFGAYWLMTRRRVNRLLVRNRSI